MKERVELHQIWLSPEISLHVSVFLNRIFIKIEKTLDHDYNNSVFIHSLHYTYLPKSTRCKVI